MIRTIFCVELLVIDESATGRRCFVQTIIRFGQAFGLVISFGMKFAVMSKRQVQSSVILFDGFFDDGLKNAFLLNNHPLWSTI